MQSKSIYIFNLILIICCVILFGIGIMFIKKLKNWDEDKKVIHKMIFVNMCFQVLNFLVLLPAFIYEI